MLTTVNCEAREGCKLNGDRERTVERAVTTIQTATHKIKEPEHTPCKGCCTSSDVC